MMTKNQTTIASEAIITGKGLHSGNQVKLHFKPAPANHGIVFQRVDLEGKPTVRAHISNIADTSRSTNLREKNVDVKTVEHLMAALAGLYIDNLLIEIDAPELPILDGSAKEYVTKLQEAGIKILDEKKEYYTVTEVVKFEKPDLGIELILVPSNHFKISVMVDYGTNILATQNATIKSMDDFTKEIFNCRTFVFIHELDLLIKNNLVKGGNMDNAIVFIDKKPDQEVLDNLAGFFNMKNIKITENGTLNNVQLHYNNEPARHKLLDLIGDLYLLGKQLKGEIIAKKPGHFVNTEFVKLIAEYAVLMRTSS